MTAEQFESIIAWQIKTFPKSSALSVMAHLSEEMMELTDELCKKAVDSHFSEELMKEEFADCFILMYGLADRAGLKYDEIVDAINKKMEVNMKRTWGEPDERGVVNHIKD